MKKLLNISVIAALAILPLAANASPVAGDPANIENNPPSGQTAQNVTAAAGPKYQLAEANANVDGVVATAGYVKGAYNAAIKAINKVSETANSAVQSVTEGATNGTVAVNGEDVAVHGLGSAAYENTNAFISSADGSVGTNNIAAGAVTKAKLDSTVQASLDAADNALQAADITTGTNNGTIKVDGTEVSVAGLKSAAYAETTAFDAAGAANTAESNAKTFVQTTLGAGANGYDIDAKTLKVGGQDVLTNAALTDYATKTGVTTTVTNAFSGAVATITNDNVTTGNAVSSATVPVVTTWGATAPADNGVAVTLNQTAVVTNVSGTAAVTPGTIAYPN